MGEFEANQGNGIYVSPVYSKQEYSVGMGADGILGDRNYLFLNTADKSTRWLAPANDKLFLGKTEMPADIPGVTGTKVEWINIP